jgi:hypothetical protein
MDFLNGFMDPKTQGLLAASGGLLAAGGRSNQPVGMGQALGQGILSGVQGYQQGIQAQRNNVMYQLQLEKLMREKKQQEALAALYGPQGSASASAPAETPSGMSPSTSMSLFGTAEHATHPPTAAPAVTGPTLAQIGQLAATGAKVDDHLKLWELRNPKINWQGGVPFDERTGQIRQGIPMLPQTNQQGFSTTPRFNPQTGQFEVGLTAGGPQAFGLQQDISESARARRDPFMGVTDASGRPIPMTREGFANTYGGVGAPGMAPQASSGASAGVPMADIVGYAPTEADALQRVRDAAKRGQTATFTVDPSRGGGMGQTAAEKTTATTVAEGDAKRVLQLEEKLPNLLSVQRRLDRMESLTKDDRTYAAAGAELKSMLGSIGQAFGLPIAKEKTANTEEYLAHVAELLKDRLASKDFGSGSGVSNLDILAAQKPLPELAKTAEGRMQLISALRADGQRAIKDAQAARDYFDANQSLRNFRFPSEVEYEQRSRVEALPKAPGTPPAPATRLKYNPKTGRIE